MKFENEFTVDAPIDEVYDALLDVERVAPCVPGAQVLEQTEDDAYKVGIKVKVGPISMLYRGSVEIVEKEPEAHRAVMRAKAKESRGQGTADARVQMQLTSDNGTTRGKIESDVQLAGKAASMGRGVIQDVSARLVDQFSQNLAAMLSGPAPAAEPEPEPAATPVEPEAAKAAGPATPTAEQPAPAWTPPADQEALDVGSALGPVIAQRLRDPKVLAGAGVVLLLLLLLRRRR